MSWNTLFADPLQPFIEGLSQASPRILAAIVFFVFGWIFAKLCKGFVVRALKLVRLDVLSKKAGVDDFLAKGGLEMNAVAVIGALTYWVLLLVALLMAVNALGLAIARDLFDQVVLYVPNVMVAIFVLIVGLWFSSFLSEVVKTAAANAGIVHATTLSAVARWAIVLFVTTMALDQLGIGEEVVRYSFLLLFGALCLAAALAFGLGAREQAGRLVEGWMKKQ